VFLDLQYLPNFNISETTSASSSYRPRMVDVTQHYAAFAICRPLTTKSLVKEQGNATCPKQIPVCRAHRRSRQRRKRGALPPVVPITLLARQRAIDLLGHYTQRRPSAKILSSIKSGRNAPKKCWEYLERSRTYRCENTTSAELSRY